MNESFQTHCLLNTEFKQGERKRTRDREREGERKRGREKEKEETPSSD